MLRTLDPHSIFFDPDQNEQLKQMENSERKGFGTIVSILPGRVIVLQAMAGTPSAKAGLQPGDEIVAVNGVELARLEFDQIVEFLGESHQHRAQLIVRRPGNARPLEFVLDPELLDSPSVDRAFLLQPGIGYVRVHGFRSADRASIEGCHREAGRGKAEGTGAGSARQSRRRGAEPRLEAASYFLKPGQKILSVKGRSIEGSRRGSSQDRHSLSFPLAVLVNAKTASAAEIVTGALQDHDRAVIIGEPSFGKGLVQNVFPLTGNTALALTTAFYYTPSGRSIQKPLPSGHLEIEKQAEQFQTDAGRSVIGGGGIQPDVAIGPEPLTRLRVALDASGIITSFATEFIQKHNIKPDFEVTPALLEEFQVYAGQRNIQPSVGEWAPGARLGAEPPEAGDFQSGAGSSEGRRSGGATRSGGTRRHGTLSHPAVERACAATCP